MIPREDNQNNSDDAEKLAQWFECREKGWSFAIQHCSFCGQKRDEWIDIFEGDEVGICEHCVAMCADGLAQQARPRCGFCGKFADQVNCLIVGKRPNAICDSCVGLCQEIIDEKN